MPDPEQSARLRGAKGEDFVGQVTNALVVRQYDGWVTYWLVLQDLTRPPHASRCHVWTGISANHDLIFVFGFPFLVTKLYKDDARPF